MSKPNLEPLKPVSPFKLACITNFPFIEADFDAVTNYELLSLVVKYLNDVIASQNTVNENVQALADAFNNLYDSVNHDLEEMSDHLDEKLAEQDELIQEYFSDINIQTFVDNKINAMIADNEFQALINAAIAEINPSALDDNKKVNVIDLGLTLVSNLQRYAFNTNFFSDSNVKAKILPILNDMKSKGAFRYYFKNTYETYLDNTYYIEAHFTDSPAYFLLGCDYDLANDAGISYNDTYIKNQGYTITIVDDEITDYTINYSYYDQNVYKILKTDNQASFTPTSDYQPATKKYVDDNAGGGGGSIDHIYTYVYSDMGTNISPYGFSITDPTDMKNLCDILTEAVGKGEKNIIIAISNTVNQNTLFKFEIRNMSLSANGNLLYRVILDQDNFKSLYAYMGSSDTYNYVRLDYTVNNGAVDSLAQNQVNTSRGGGYIPIGNQNSWSPSYDFEPATKFYVDFQSRYDFSAYIGLVNQTDTQSYSGDPLIGYKQDQICNIRGTIEVLNPISTSQLAVEIYDQAYAPNAFGSTNWTECYTTAFLYVAATTSYEPVGCYISFTANGNLATIRFQPFDTNRTTYAAGDAIRFNMMYIKK